MKNTLKVNLNKDSALYELLIQQYNTWAKTQEFLHSDNLTKVEMINSGIPSFLYYDINNINKHDNKLIIIDNLNESVHSLKYFNQYNKSNFYIIFSGGNRNRSYYNFDLNYANIDFFSFIQYAIQSCVGFYNESYYFSKQYDFLYPKENIFLSTTGSRRPERDYFINNLIENINYKDYILKYQSNNLGKDYDFLDFKNFDSENDFNPYQPLIGQSTLSSIIPNNLYNQAYFNLVVETDIDFVDSFFPTEKTIKSLISGIPFVVYSTPKFLKNLSKLGFKTYSDLWNEDYDDESDYKVRAEMIVELCNNLKTFDWENNCDQLINIANHNSNILLKNNKMFIKQLKKISQVFKIIANYDTNSLNYKKIIQTAEQ